MTPEGKTYPGERVPLGKKTIRDDQWFLAGLEIGAQREQQRIIKLFKQYKGDFSLVIGIIRGEMK